MEEGSASEEMVNATAFFKKSYFCTLLKSCYACCFCYHVVVYILYAFIRQILNLLLYPLRASLIICFTLCSLFCSLFFRECLPPMDPNFYSYDIQGGTQSPDTSETVQISSLALLKMMKHGRAGIPLEVMGLMLGEFIDEYNVRVIDVFAMPQSGTGTTVEAVDPAFQAQMVDTLKQTGRHETVVGWYHSHPGFGCWLSSTDVSTQSSFEQICKRAVAVVIDPIQSVKGKVVIDAFRNITSAVLDREPRITTSNIGFLKQPSFISLVHGLNKHYYSFNITFKKNDLERKMLLNMNRKSWADNLKMRKPLRPLFRPYIEKYCKMVREEKNLDFNERELHRVGKIDYKRRLEEYSNEIVEQEVIEKILHSVHSLIFS